MNICNAYIQSQKIKNNVYKLKFGHVKGKIGVEGVEKRHFFNAETGEIEYIDDKSVTVKGVPFLHNELCKNFSINFCTSVYRVKGATIEREYQIHDANQ